MRKIYIAYGSNMDTEQMEFRCPDAKIVDTGKISGWRLMFKGSKTGNYATIEQEENFSVPVLVWEISEADEAELDYYEGFPKFYYKREIEVELDDGRTVKGMAYIMHEERALGQPSIKYLKKLAAAYDKFGFDLQILMKAFDYSAG